MSFQGPGLGQERVNRKQLLEQLEEKKKILRMQAQHNQTGSSASVPSSPVTSPSVTSPTAGSPASPTNNGNIPPGSITPTMPIGMPSATPLNTGREINPMLINPLTAPSSYDASPMTPAQRTALQHAHANSVGYFIPQDSSFGNLILPVIPRFDAK